MRSISYFLSSEACIGIWKSKWSLLIVFLYVCTYCILLLSIYPCLEGWSLEQCKYQKRLTLRLRSLISFKAGLALPLFGRTCSWHRPAQIPVPLTISEDTSIMLVHGLCSSSFMMYECVLPVGFFCSAMPRVGSSMFCWSFLLFVNIFWMQVKYCNETKPVLFLAPSFPVDLVVYF